MAGDWYSDLNRRVQREVSRQKLLEHDENEYKRQRKEQELIDNNSDLNSSVRRNLEHQKYLEENAKMNALLSISQRSFY